MENDPKEPFAGADWADWKEAQHWRYVWRWWILNRASSGVLVAPLIYVPAAISGNRLFLAGAAGGWVIGQIGNGLSLFVGDEAEDPRPTGAAFWQAAAFQAAGLAPWLALAAAWRSLTTPGLLLLLPALLVWGMAGLVLSSGEGANLRARIRTSLHRILAMVVAGICAFVAVVLGLVLLIKALHPLAH